MDKTFRVMAAGLVMRSQLPAKIKNQFVNFIKEASSDAQVKALLMDGEIVSLDEASEALVNQRWKLSAVGHTVSEIRKTYTMDWVREYRE